MPTLAPPPPLPAAAAGTPPIVPRRARGRRAARPRPRTVDALTLLLGLGLGVTIALGLTTVSASSLQAPGGAWTFAGRMTGLVGAYAMLVTVLLAGRLPVVERLLGQDRLIAWHRRLAPWGLVLIAAHGVATLLGYAGAAQTGLASEAWSLLTTVPGILAATVGFGAVAAAGVTSYRLARRRMSYETWWAVHLYTYLGLALSFSHQLATGASFIGHPLARAFWIVLWAGTAGAVLAYRIGLPAWRSARHRLRVEAVQHETPGVVSVILRGRRLDRLPISGGQFANWRFLVRGLWWQAHPYSLSALPDRDCVRITVKDLGDHSAGLATLRPGTRVAFEGPYGAFTVDRSLDRPVLLVGAGVGTTPVRTLLDDLPGNSRPIVMLRGHDAHGLPLADEIAALTAERGGTMHRLLGPRDRVAMNAHVLRAAAQDLLDREVYVCGPAGFTDLVLHAARTAGVPERQLHHETFDL